MKKCRVNFFVTVFVIIAKIQAYPTEIDEDRIRLILEKDVSIRWMTGEEAPIDNILTELEALVSSDKPNRIHFYLYTQAYSNEPVEIDMNDLETLVRSPYDYRNPTYFMIHGWKDAYTAGLAIGIKNALLQNGQNREINFISVDWRVYSQFQNYTISQQLCSPAGKVVAQFIDWMHENAKLQFETLTVYGSSMGAHVAGFAGKNVQHGKVHSIIVMDPALPEFPCDNPKGRLADTDADYVESIHTNGGHWGFYEPIGQTAFYPNGGKNQPGCGSDIDGGCSHVKAAWYLIEALSSPEENKFDAVKCERFEDVEERKCNQYQSVIQMGDPRNAHKSRGIYYLETNSKSPYAKGATYNENKTN